MSFVNAAVFSPDGKRVASLAQNSTGDITKVGNKTVRLWETATGLEISGPWKEDDQGGISSVAFSPDGALVAALGRKVGKMAKGIVQIGEGQRIAIWGIPGKKMVCNIDASPERVFAMVFADSGKSLVTANKNAVQWWDVATGKELRSRNLFGDEESPAKADGKKGSKGLGSGTFSPDGRYLAMQTWRIEDQKNARQIQRRRVCHVGHSCPQGGLAGQPPSAYSACFFQRR